MRPTYTMLRTGSQKPINICRFAYGTAPDTNFLALSERLPPDVCPQSGAVRKIGSKSSGDPAMCGIRCSPPRACRHLPDLPCLPHRPAAQTPGTRAFSAKNLGVALAYPARADVLRNSSLGNAGMPCFGLLVRAYTPVVRTEAGLHSRSPDRLRPSTRHLPHARSSTPGTHGISHLTGRHIAYTLSRCLGRAPRSFRVLATGESLGS